MRFNSVRRATLLRRVHDPDTLRPLACFFGAVLAPRSRIYLCCGYNLTRAGFESEEGVQQAGVESAPGFCIAITPELAALDSELGAVEGMARAGLDDTYAVGQPEIVFSAIRRFKDALRENFELELREDKSAYYIDSLALELFNRHQIEGHSSSDLAGDIPQRTIIDDSQVLKVYAVRIGSDGYVHSFLDSKRTTVLGLCRGITLQLGRRNKQSL